MTDRYLIVGLGNPGRRYAKTRHNAGFQVVDHLAARHELQSSRKQNGAALMIGTIAGKAVVLAKPQSYMNRSGGPVAALSRFYRIAPANLLVVFDDLDLPVGTLRLRPSGGSGGQNGMKDIIRQLGHEDFPRLRVGIGRPVGRMDPVGYVLQGFGDDQRIVMSTVYDRAADAIETWLMDGIVLAMSRHNAPADNGPGDKTEVAGNT